MNLKSSFYRIFQNSKCSQFCSLPSENIDIFLTGLNTNKTMQNSFIFFILVQNSLILCAIMNEFRFGILICVHRKHFFIIKNSRYGLKINRKFRFKSIGISIFLSFFNFFFLGNIISAIAHKSIFNSK